MWPRSLAIGASLIAITLTLASCGGSGSSSGTVGTTLYPTTQGKMLNDARVQSYFLVGIWDHLNDHCRKAYRSRSGDNPKTRRAEATQAGHCIDQLYRWIGVRHAVLNYAHIMHLLAGGVHGACSTALETTSKKLTTFAAALDKAEKDLAAYDFKKLLQGGDTQKFHEADAAFLAAEKAMLSACNVHLNLTLS